MATQQKSNEHLQAQVASFLNEAGRGVANEHLLDAVGELAISGEVEHPVMYQEYTDFLRSADDAQREEIAAKEAYIQAYTPFAELRKHDSYEEPFTGAAYVGSGNSIHAFALTYDGKEYVAKIPRFIGQGGRKVEERVHNMAPARGIAGLEQLVAISYEDPCMIVERVPGKDFTAMEVQDFEQITDTQLEVALDVFDKASAVGVTFETNPGNYFYDKDQGFQFVDYHRPKDERDASVAFMVDRFAKTLGTRGVARNTQPLSTEAFQDMVALHSASLDVLHKLKKIYIEKSDVPASTKAIDTEIEEITRFMEEAQDPEWVAAQIEWNTICAQAAA